MTARAIGFGAGLGTEPQVQPGRGAPDDVPVVSVESVTKRFGEVVALDDVSLTVGAGELVGMLGPNGAGKSTLLSLVGGQRRPDAGAVRLVGADPRDASARVSLGVTPQETGLPPTLKVREVVEFVGRHYPHRVDTADLLGEFGISDLARRQTGSLSGGQRRRLAVALSLVGRPRVVLLDEPTTGLDVGARQALWAAIRRYHADGGTVLLTSHYLEEVQELAERVVVIDRGVVRADDSLDAILARVALHRVVVRSSAPLDALPGVVRSERSPATTGSGRLDRFELYTPDADALVRELVTSGVTFSGLEIRGASLEEAFEEMVAVPDGSDGTSGTSGTNEGSAR
ncbi:ABC transporter ATP-binding protein [Paraoerskovia sediminicola]|uniref:ABC transporter ATP-binding protein n=1 Tax=Paraoerskovia sediminicola TaxID=1138587 RepID=A0ABN6XAA2_9CELL|nr:ABC transporter ATP-binding protein [Paraoerskovia sediminicola]BDZ41694.1 ABC transporter ATP-binding protein [Paraoerskovia sediminicola]